jgi:hypothetical protein
VEKSGQNLGPDVLVLVPEPAAMVPEGDIVTVAEILSVSGVSKSYSTLVLSEVRFDLRMR